MSNSAADSLGSFAKANAALAEREHQLSVLFNTIADVTFVLNVEGEGATDSFWPTKPSRQPLAFF